MQVNPFDLVMAQLNEAVPPLPERPGLTPALRAAVMRALEKAPTQRWQAAGELEAALRAALGELVGKFVVIHGARSRERASPAYSTGSRQRT